jgi:hydrogenase nickel incorporation protein HypB
MCATCGCGDEGGVRVFGPGHLGHDDEPAPRPEHARPEHAHEHNGGHTGSREHEHEHEHGHGQGHEPGAAGRTVELQQKILAKNDRLAQENRAWLTARGILAVNLMSSPGSGKTTLLERTARDAGARLGLAVIEGDQETTLDASRIEAAGCAVAQINTGAGCHLDASMIASALRALDPRPGSVLVIENVGNLVCPALFDLGEAARVVLSSVT